MEKKTLIKSMTGFGRAEEITDNYKLSVEIKSVNHRYLDLNIKMPRRFFPFEADIRNIVKEYVSRGKVDLFINYLDFKDKAGGVYLNKNIVEKYLDIGLELCKEYKIVDDLKVSHLLQLPDVISIDEPELDEDEIKSRLFTVLKKACKVFLSTREAEGEKLFTDMSSKLKVLADTTENIDKRYPEVLEEYKAKLTLKVNELLSGASIEENRIATEVTLFADKIGIDEEVVRLFSHIKAMNDEMKLDTGIGRKLDFLAQEMNREANTILSKSTDLNIADYAIILKTEIEKIREQIQNIE
ncbi:TIGR00255 family protein [Lachnoanaerobaculum saburreum DSM 3986]|jgi:TIGR00255 family protein|uniref:TIGR00255 family protein n=1 Tax=Lachnoanaerobaculum saburreum DSM 3986 TaxID=887325 RepID=E6LNH4_9FIRM|nr:YicC/YloC family endoribonuclease [Lachnoanaerobaculum saburreum]EFU76590.1 TIGR00255 family protein [Lachnoanaerobaculum saburreum DSM 3986]